MITRDDITAKRFTRAFRGYDIAEVDEYLDLLASEIERLEARRTEDMVRIAELTKRLERAEGIRK